MAHTWAKMSEINTAIPRPKIKKLPKALAILDTEALISYPSTDKMVFTFKMGCLIFLEIDNTIKVKSRKIYFCDSLEDFYFTIEYLHSKHAEIYLFGHNIGFDLRILNAFRTFTKIGYSSSAPIINQRIFIWRIKKARHSMRIIDTANLGVISVEQLGIDVGLPKLEADFEHDTDEQLKIYCLRDCEILEKFILSYIRIIYEHQLGGFKLTLAAQALHSFLVRFYHDDIYPHHLQAAIELEKSAYHGGRSEAFTIHKVPKDTYYLLDINSMYPTIMANSLLPNKIRDFKSDDNLIFSPTIFNDYYIIAEVEVDTNENCYPQIINKRLCFPTGKFITTLHHCELLYALPRGHIKRINKVSVYTKARIFADYAKFFLEMRSHYRNECNETYSYIMKILANSLYGKMAQAAYIRLKLFDDIGVDFGRMPFYSDTLKSRGQYIAWNGTLYKEYKSGFAPHSFLAIAGAITAIGRMWLYSLMNKAGKENCFMCDTDSLLVNQNGYNNLNHLINANKYGALKIDKQSDYLIIYGTKDYEIGDKIRRKGIKSKAVQTKENEFEQWNFSSVNAWLNSGGQGTVEATRIVKHRKGDYYKGIFDDTTGRITPYSLD